MTNTKPDLFPSSQPKITIWDKPCGSGKSSALIQKLKDNTNGKTLIVAPLLDEVSRYLEQLPHFVSPTDETTTKTEDIQRLLHEGKSLVCTHSLYPYLAESAKFGRLQDYDIYIDEVPEVIGVMTHPSYKSFDEIYRQGGFVTVAPDEKISPTSKWDEQYESVSDTLSKSLYVQAKTDCLYLTDKKAFIWALPPALLTNNKSLTILTFLFEGSCLKHYLKKLNITFRVDKSLELEQQMKSDIRKLLTVKTIHSLEKESFSYTGQSKTKGRKVSRQLARLRDTKGELKGVPHENILITSVKDKWYNSQGEPGSFSKGSRLISSPWIPNTTRGTNKYSHCTHAIYLYNQYLNPVTANWLRMSQEDKEAYGLSEFIQWIYRTKIRNGHPVTAYIPSSRMRQLLYEFCNPENAEMPTGTSI